MQLRKVLRTISKVLLIGTGLLVAGLLVAHLVWKYSGSGQWEQVLSKNGVTIYARKNPGSTLKEFKGVRTVKTTLNTAVAAMKSTDIEDCADWIPGCASGMDVERWNPQGKYFIHYYHVNYGGPFSPREFLLKTHFTRTAEKGVLVEFTALPNLLPRHDCCYRIEDMHNSWRYTPLANGDVQVELQVHMDHGLPYFMINRGAPYGLYSLFSELPRLINKDKFTHADPNLLAQL